MNIIDIVQKDFFYFIKNRYYYEQLDSNPHAFSLNIDESKAAFGDINSNISMILAKQLKRPPKDIALEISNDFQHECIQKVEVAGVGFLNFYLTEQAFIELKKEIFIQQRSFFVDENQDKKKINIEFVSANPTGPLHFGHGRGGIIGDTLARIYTFLGHRVTKEFYINDAGAQMQKLGLSLKARCLQVIGFDTVIPEGGYQGEYLIDLAKQCVKEVLDWEKKNDLFFIEYAKEHLLQAIKKTLLLYNIEFDLWFSEKTLHENEIEATLTLLKEKNLLYQKDDAWWFASTQFGDDKDRVVKRGNGELTYIAADIAYLQNKIKRGYDKLIMILGHDHHGYVHRLEASLEALGYPATMIDVVLYQLVHIVKSGESVKMSKRAGNIVTLEDIIDTVSVDVARFFYLYKKADSPLEFDLALALKKTDENPLFYIQYAYVRALSIIKKATEKEMSDIITYDITHISFEAKFFIRQLCSLKYLLKDIVKNNQTHLLASKALEIATSFHQYYAKYTILDDSSVTESRNRLALVYCARNTIALLCDLLGVTLPEKM